MNFLEKAQEIEDQIIAWRRDIHAHPELGFEETRTANVVAEALRGMGIEAEVGVGQTGVVARIGNGNGRKIGIRGDMDALPIQEVVDLPFASTVAGKMHACGHDAHTAMLLGVARMLHEVPEINGEIRLLFQPAEENNGHRKFSGAEAMINDNALDELDSVIALHVSSEHPIGEVHVTDGTAMAASDPFFAKIKGIGCHGASPHTGLDPIWLATQVINALQAIRSRRTDPTSASVVTIGAILGGNAPNVIPHEVELRGTIRSFDEDIRKLIHEEVDRALQLTRVFGGDYELDIKHGYPPLHNDPAVAQLLRDVAGGVVGAEKVVVGKPLMGGEDFAYMARKAPGAMMFLGVKYDDMNRPHHSPTFAISEEPFKYGSAILAETAMRLLTQS